MKTILILIGLVAIVAAVSISYVFIWQAGYVPTTDEEAEWRLNYAFNRAKLLEGKNISEISLNTNCTEARKKDWYAYLNIMAAENIVIELKPNEQAKNEILDRLAEGRQSAQWKCINRG